MPLWGDLEALLKKNWLRRFHLYGQSLVVYWPLSTSKRLAERASEDSSGPGRVFCQLFCPRLTTSVTLVEEEANRLVAALDAGDDTVSVAERFRLEHQCRTPKCPMQLADAYAHALVQFGAATAIAGCERGTVGNGSSYAILHGPA
jgi:hypothetical protein